MNRTQRWRRWPRSWRQLELDSPLGQRRGRSRSGKPSPEAEKARDRDVAGLADLEYRLELAAETVDEAEPDPAERDRLAEQSRLARAAEMDARLAMRTLEERARALAGRADALRRAAEVNVSRGFARSRGASECCVRRVRRLPFMPERRSWRSISNVLALAARERSEADAARGEAEAALSAARASVRSLTRDFESLVDAAHRDDLARGPSSR